jgi:peptide chain release factor subunit 1
VQSLVLQKVAHFYGCQTTTSESVKQHKLRKLIAWLSDKQAKDTEFVSLYIPSNVPIDTVVARLKNESDASKPKTRDSLSHLQEIFRNLLQRVRGQKQLPENGLVLYAGFFLASDGESEVLNIEELTPPQPITNYLCVIDDHFQLEPLRDMLRDQRIVGFIAVDAKEASFGILNGGQFRLLQSLTSGIPGKTGKGGQSQRRYERERDMEVANFFHRVAEHANKEFIEKTKVTSLAVGGPGPTKHDFLKSNYLNYELKNSLLIIIDTQSARPDGVKEMLAKTSEALMNACGPEEKKTMDRLMAELSKNDGLAISGLDPVLEGLKNGEVEVALVTDSSDLVEIVAACKNCGLSKTEVISKKNTQSLRDMISTPCTRCHSVEYEVVEKDMIDVVEDEASKTDARVEVIFTGTEEKAKLATLGGFAALLRYKPS